MIKLHATRLQKCLTHKPNQGVTFCQELTQTLLLSIQVLLKQYFFSKFNKGVRLFNKFYLLNVFFLQICWHWLIHQKILNLWHKHKNLPPVTPFQYKIFSKIQDEYGCLSLALLYADNCSNCMSLRVEMYVNESHTNILYGMTTFD